MLNRILIMGRLVRDPELRTTQTGTSVATFTLAVDRDFKDKNTGEKATDFIDVVAWRQTGEFVSKFFSKGRMAIVEGRLQMRDWTDKDNNKRRSAEIIADGVYFGDSNPNGSQTTQQNNYQNTYKAPQNNYQPQNQQPNNYQPQNQQPNNYQPQNQQPNNYQPQNNYQQFQPMNDDENGDLPF